MDGELRAVPAVWGDTGWLYIPVLSEYLHDSMELVYGQSAGCTFGTGGHTVDIKLEGTAFEHISFQIEEGAFVVLCGPSGSGKTTLLKHFKPILTPHGARTGERLFRGRPLEELSDREQAAEIGYVFQSPDQQIVTDKVWHELAFGLESLG